MSAEEVMQQSLFEEANMIELNQHLEKERKKAFRIAFDFLESHWPVKNTEEYWTKTCEDVGKVYEDNYQNELCKELLQSVMMYLDHEAKNNGF